MGRRVIERPWTVVAADIMGPFPPSRQGFQYVLVFQDLFSKWIECCPLRKANAPAILKAFDELIVLRWGTPEVLLTDNGSEFSNRLVTAACQDLGVVQSTIPPYHAQANPVERCNRVLKTMISAFLEADHREWDRHLAEFRFAVNSATHSSTKVTLAFMNLGRELRQAGSVRRATEAPPIIVPIPQLEWESRVRCLPALHDLVNYHLENASARQAFYYDRGRRDQASRLATGCGDANA